jgi:RNA-directed DNA polymerase
LFIVKKRLSVYCSHIKGNGGLKGAVRYLKNSMSRTLYFARFDIKSYYESIDHKVFFSILSKWKINAPLKRVIAEYITLSGKKGIPSGGSLSPLLGAIYLDPLDQAMEKLKEKGDLHYIRYMDDYVICSSKRWHLKQAIATMYRILKQLKLEVHPDKRSIGRCSKGLDFLGYYLDPKRKLQASTTSLSRFLSRFRRLYERGAKTSELWRYVIQWTRWLWGGLWDLVSQKGGAKRYYFHALLVHKIKKMLKPYQSTTSR